ncbi:hypothetical protein BDR04DRAFT_1091257 [Suillus decipiens]|nr:hypothetical protein BDR04DRAFT_1091257 [Suillus decipiens]
MSQEGGSTNKPGRRVHQQASREDPPMSQGASTNSQGGPPMSPERGSTNNPGRVHQ